MSNTEHAQSSIIFGDAPRKLAMKDVLPSHPARNPFFTNGKPLEETVDELRKNPQKVLPKMKYLMANLVTQQQEVEKLPQLRL